MSLLDRALPIDEPYRNAPGAPRCAPGLSWFRISCSRFGGFAGEINGRRHVVISESRAELASLSLAILQGRA